MGKLPCSVLKPIWSYHYILEINMPLFSKYSLTSNHLNHFHYQKHQSVANVILKYISLTYIVIWVWCQTNYDVDMHSLWYLVTFEGNNYPVFSFLLTRLDQFWCSEFEYAPMANNHLHIFSEHSIQAHGNWKSTAPMHWPYITFVEPTYHPFFFLSLKETLANRFIKLMYRSSSLILFFLDNIGHTLSQRVLWENNDNSS